MRVIWVLVFCFVLAAPAVAQDDDPSYVEGLIQDALSEAGRDVRVTGFRGALSSNATMERLTIADEDGVWLSLEDASLVWSRAALLRGRLEVDELTAGRIELSRLPQSDPDAPKPEDAEATPFALPDLPVSIELGELRADEVVLGPSLLGEAATLSVTGKMSLIDGAADVDLSVVRQDRDDRLTLIAAFANATNALKIDLDVQEAAGGILSRAAQIPGAPSLGLTVTGDAPLSAFEAVIALASDGVDRFGGTVGISAPEEAAPGAYQFRANLEGDLRPLVSADLHPFFGDRAALRVAGRTQAGGAVTLDQMDMTTGALRLSGTLALSEDGLPDRFALEGRIAGDGPVRLPVADPVTLVDDVVLTAGFDTAQGDGWAADVTVRGLDRDGLSVDQAVLKAFGQIQRGMARAVTADTTFEVTGFAHRDAALSTAVGPAPDGRVVLRWTEGAPIDISQLDLRSAGATLQASGQVDGLADGFPITGRAVLSAPDLTRFAGLAGRPLSGAANLGVDGMGTPL
ncbi:MAG: hypothetical protein AAFY25_00585, partial [Pseudomonadota bacterium]